MKNAKKRKLPRFLVILLVFLCVLAAIPLLVAGLSFSGRITADSLVPDGSVARAFVPNPASTAARVMDHKGIDSLLADPVLTPIAPLVTGLRESRLLDNPLVRLALNNPLTAAVYNDGRALLCYDTGMLSVVARLSPAIISRKNITGLYRVTAGNHSRFEYRPKEGAVIFAGMHHNLLIVSNNQTLFESVIDGSPTALVESGNEALPASQREQDAAILLDTRLLLATFAPEDPDILALIETLDIPNLAQADLSIEDEKIDITVTVSLSSRAEGLQRILAKQSAVPSIQENFPLTTQYATTLSTGTLKELLDLARTIRGPALDETLATAESSSKFILGMTLEQLLYSWTGSEFAAFGLEGRPNPVFAVEISDERQRRLVFDTLASSIAITQDDSVVLDGMRIPSIRVPSFLLAVLKIWDITVPTQYYLVENGFLYFSQSPENLLDTVRSVRNNTSLIRQDVWKQLAGSTDDRSAVSLFYSLDRSIPFFLRGNSALQRILKLYGRGLARAQLGANTAVLSLSLLAGEPTGIIPIPGYPVETGGKTDNKVSLIEFLGKNEKRIVITLDGTTVLAINPRNGKQYTWTANEKVQVVTDPSLKPVQPEDPALWIVTSRGRVSLATANLEPVQGFPVSTGAMLSAEPAAFGGRLYLPDQDTSMHVVSPDGSYEVRSMPYTDVLRSPPSFILDDNNPLMGVYPKGFFSELWLMNESGAPQTGWPVSVSGIAFGSPTLFTADGDLFMAFITQAGDLTVFTDRGSLKSGFPVTIPGVFYAQPVFCGTWLWVLSAGGRLYRIGMDGRYTWRDIPDLTAENAVIRTHDVTGDGTPEIFATGDANALYGFTRELEPLDNFPLPAWGTPWFGDINGDGIANCFAVGMDYRLYGWQLR